MTGKTLRIQIYFKDGGGNVTLDSIDASLAGFAELFDDIFHVNTCPMATLALLFPDVPAPPEIVKVAIPGKKRRL